MNAGRVLFVNDVDDRQIYTNVLRDRGHFVIEATDPERALRVLDEDKPPDVVVTEIVFGNGMPGASFIRELRTRLDLATSIIVLSRYVRADDRNQTRAVGADLFVTRPAAPAVVLLEVERALILRRGGRRLSWNWAARPAVAAIPPAHERRRRS